jgi:hypothetical protein
MLKFDAAPAKFFFFFFLKTIFFKIFFWGDFIELGLQYSTILRAGSGCVGSNSHPHKNEADERWLAGLISS